MISVYLKDSTGLGETNLAILQELSAIIAMLSGPWIIGGDWNLEPQALKDANWLNLVHGTAVFPCVPTCNSSVYDFFVVADALVCTVAGIARVDGAGLHPHAPSRLYLRSDAKRMLTRQLVKPAKVPGLLPFGPLPEPVHLDAVKPTGVSLAEVDRAMKAWDQEARKEWSSLLLEPRAEAPPVFRWKPAAGPRAAEYVGKCAGSTFLRGAARRLDECAAMIDRRSTYLQKVTAMHLLAISQGVAGAGFHGAELDATQHWVRAAPDVVMSADTVAIRRHAAIATKRAAALEARLKSARMTEWRRALAIPNPRTGLPSGTPSRLAYQWIKGPTGWTRSPLGCQSLNDAALAEQHLEDEAPAHHLTVAKDEHRLIVGDDLPARVPLSDQADAEAEASSWAALWNEGEEYNLDISPSKSDPLPPLRPADLRRSAASFPVGTGVSGENVAPRALERLSDRLLAALCAILMACELLGAWPTMINLVLIVLLPKTDGGRRPIGLFPAVIRVWGRARRNMAQRWEAAHAIPGIYGCSGMGAQRAAWQCAFRAENAGLSSRHFAEALLDLVKAFEKVPHQVLVAVASRLGFNLWLLRLSLASYRLPRAIGVQGTFSRCIVAARGITAGSCFATTELRLIMQEALVYTTRIWRSVIISLYVDDCTLEADGPGGRPEALVAGASGCIIRYLEDEMDLEVSVAKSVVVGSTARVARSAAAADSSGKLSAVASAKLLGTPAAGGRKRSARIQRRRISTFKAKKEKFHKLRKMGINTTAVARTAGVPAMSYGWDTTGVADSTLRIARAAVAAAVAPEAGGKSPEVVLMLADSAGGAVDPAYAAHSLPIVQWATAHWEGWQATARMERAFLCAIGKLRSATRTVWDHVVGPVTALVATLWRLQWAVCSPVEFLDDLGDPWRMGVDPPAAVARAVKASVRRWQVRQVMIDLPIMVPEALDFGVPADVADVPAAAPALAPPDIPPFNLTAARLPPSVVGVVGPVGRLLTSKGGRSKFADGWCKDFRGHLRSAACGGQWPQVRVAKLYEEEVDTRCQLCFTGPGALAHRAACPATRPEGGWPTPPADVKELLNRLDEPRRLLVATRGLFALRLAIPRGRPGGWKRWLIGSPELADDECTWYVDGSMVDGKWQGTTRTGFGIVIVGPDGGVRGIALGSPPSWVTSAAGAEAWALLETLQACPGTPKVVTDCLGLIQQLERGGTDATGSRRPLARLWRLIFSALDGQVPQEWLHREFVWMGSHSSKAAIGRAQKSNGDLVSATDWRANRLADGLAKMAAGRFRVPEELRRLLRTADRLVEHSAAVLGLQTHAANNYQHTAWRDDGTAYTTKLRDATPRPYWAHGTGARPNATGTRAKQPNPDTEPTKEGATSAPLLAAPTETASERPREADRRLRAQSARQDKQAQEETRFQTSWHLDRAQEQRTPQPYTAAARLEALKQRVLKRAGD